VSTLLAPGVTLVKRLAPDVLILDVRRHFGTTPMRPSEWLAQANHVKREGAGPGSLTEDGLEYHVLTGDWVEAEDPGLYEAYLDLVPAVSQALGRKLVASEDVRSRLNINLLSGRGSTYELHTDSQPYTGILFVTEHALGGELLITQPPRDPQQAPPLDGSYSGGAEWHVRPQPGLMVLFDGQRYPHAVLPLRADELRVTIPMVFVDPDAGEVRPEGTDEHLYA